MDERINLIVNKKNIKDACTGGSGVAAPKVTIEILTKNICQIKHHKNSPQKTGMMIERWFEAVYFSNLMQVQGLKT